MRGLFSRSIDKPRVLKLPCCYKTLQSYLVLLQPFLQQLLAALLQDRPAQFKRLKLVQLALVQKNTEVLQQWRGLTWLGRDTLELTDGLCRPQDSLREGKTVEKRGIMGKGYKYSSRTNDKVIPLNLFI